MNCVITKIFFRPEFRQLLIGTSISRYFPPNGTAGFDRSFVSGIAVSRESSALLHTLVQLGKALNLDTLAEGIEEPAQLKALQRELCDQGQGFLFARPLSPTAVEEFLGAAGPVGSRVLAAS